MGLSRIDVEPLQVLSKVPHQDKQVNSMEHILAKVVVVGDKMVVEQLGHSHNIVIGSHILPSRYCHRVPHTSLGIAVGSHILP